MFGNSRRIMLAKKIAEKQVRHHQMHLAVEQLRTEYNHLGAGTDAIRFNARVRAVLQAQMDELKHEISIDVEDFYDAG